MNAASDQYTVTWCSVRGFDSSQTTTAQATLLPDGTIEMKYASGITLANARSVNPQIEVFEVSAYSGEGLSRWYAWLEGELAACEW